MTLASALYELGAGSFAAGFGPVERALTLTPARPSASMKAVRAKAEGSSIVKVCTSVGTPGSGGT